MATRPTVGSKHQWLGPWRVVATDVSHVSQVVTLQAGDLYLHPDWWSRLDAGSRARDRPRRQVIREESCQAIATPRAHDQQLIEQLEESRATIEQLERALKNRTLIGQAQGILMERLGIDAEQATKYLMRASNELNQKRFDVAADIAETRNLPNFP